MKNTKWISFKKQPPPTDKFIVCRNSRHKWLKIAEYFPDYGGWMELYAMPPEGELLKPTHYFTFDMPGTPY